MLNERDDNDDMPNPNALRGGDSSVMRPCACGSADDPDDAGPLTLRAHEDNDDRGGDTAMCFPLTTNAEPLPGEIGMGALDDPGDPGEREDRGGDAGGDRASVWPTFRRRRGSGLPITLAPASGSPKKPVAAARAPSARTVICCKSDDDDPAPLRRRGGARRPDT